jgi:hypothetical protein
MAPCPGCGIDEATIAVPDAIAAIRSFPRRYREVLDATPPALLRARPDPGTWSVVEYAVHTREVLEVLAMALPLVLEQPNLVLPDVEDETTGGAGGEPKTFPDWLTDRDILLAGLTKACDRLATRAEQAPWSAWDRTFAIGDHQHVAAWIPQHAAHEGGHHLRDIEHVLRRLGVEDR